jgi:glycosyltransferase involved in cell wall biosynthesis
MTREIVLGPRTDLHTGVHYSLAGQPPAGFRYRLANGRHTFLMEGAPGSPHRNAHVLEAVDFGDGPEIVHSCRWPVLNRAAWVADTDDFGYPALCGRHGLNPEFRRRFREPWPPEFDAQIRRRLRNMLSAYLHPTCRRVFMRSRHAIGSARDWLESLDAGPAAGAFLEKVRVLYPAQRAIPWQVLSGKWALPAPLEIVFCGRDYRTKNGSLALTVFGRAVGPGVRCTYIGEIPDDEAERHKGVLRRLTWHPSLDRSAVLEVLAGSHVLFHPSPYEGLGTVFLEASAAGMAVICSKGLGMEHVSEIFEEDGALFVDRDEDAGVFEERLHELMANPAAARQMGFSNYERAANGRFSLAERDRQLVAAYEEALSGGAGEPLSVEDLPDCAGTVAHTMSSEEVKADETAYRAEIGMQEARLDL